VLCRGNFGSYRLSWRGDTWWRDDSSKVNSMAEDILVRLFRDRFRYFFRVNSDSFVQILETVEGHGIFQNRALITQVDPIL